MTAQKKEKKIFLKKNINLHVEWQLLVQIFAFYECIATNF